MGDYGSSIEITGRTTSILDSFSTGVSRSHQYGELIAYSIIRDAHRDHHITTVDAKDANLTGFAAAGHATATLIREDDQFFAIRGYSPPATRMESGQGRLGEKVRFGLYTFEHEGHELKVYVGEWYTYYAALAKAKFFYILTPKAILTPNQAHSPAADNLISAAGKWTSELHQEVYVFDSGAWTKSKTLWSAVQSSSFDDVVLDPSMKQALIKDITGFFDSRATYEEYSVPWKRGIIFHGTPGCGKTISIKALMNSLQSRNVASLYVKAFKCCQGEQYAIRTIFQKARIMAPCMLIFEDLDSLVVDKVRSYFLNEVDGLENNDGILMIGSTNHLERLDPGISKRPSRFDRKYHYRLPGERERILYCEYWKKKLAKNDSIDFHYDISQIISDLTAGFSFAYMKELFVQSLLAIVSGSTNPEDEDEQYDHFGEAEKESKLVERPTLEKTSKDGDQKTMSESGEEAAKEAKDGAEPAVEEKDKKRKPIEQKPKPERVLPQVIIPSHLENNTFMRVLHRQAKLLWREMDNTEDEIHGRQKTAGASNPDDDAFMSRVYAGGPFGGEDEDDCGC